MSPEFIIIKNSRGEEVNRWPVDNEAIGSAVALEVELHNRDNQDDPWEVGEE